jgi:hypothetical protein
MFSFCSSEGQTANHSGTKTAHSPFAELYGKKDLTPLNVLYFMSGRQDEIFMAPVRKHVMDLLPAEIYPDTPVATSWCVA